MPEAHPSPAPGRENPPRIRECREGSALTGGRRGAPDRRAVGAWRNHQGPPTPPHPTPAQSPRGGRNGEPTYSRAYGGIVCNRKEKGTPGRVWADCYLSPWERWIRQSGGRPAGEHEPVDGGQLLSPSRGARSTIWASPRPDRPSLAGQAGAGGVLQPVAVSRSPGTAYYGARPGAVSGEPPLRCRIDPGWRATKSVGALRREELIPWSARRKVEGRGWRGQGVGWKEGVDNSIL